LHRFHKRSLWYQHGVRGRAVFAAVALGVAACGAPSAPSDTPSPSSASAQVNPARIDRARDHLPQGYEVSDLTGRAAPAAFWGFGGDWTADPPQCGVLADPAAGAATTRGWSASGGGGIVYAAIAGSPPDPVHLDAAVVDACGRWTLSGGQANGDVTLTPAPEIDGAVTVAMSTTTTTVVEGGTETRAHADTVLAYLDDYVALVTVVTDPGSANSQLGHDFAAALMVKTVSALRGWDTAGG
jgi:hypothetical protein